MNDNNTIYYEPNMKLYGFVMIPNAVLFDKDLSPDAKTIYAILLSRTQLSASPEYINRFSEKDGRIFIYYPLEDMMKTANVGRHIVDKAYKELKSKDLLVSVRQGLGKANKLYIKMPSKNVDGYFEDDEKDVRTGFYWGDTFLPAIPIKHDDKENDFDNWNDDEDDFDFDEPDTEKPEQENQI